MKKLSTNILVFLSFLYILNCYDNPIFICTKHTQVYEIQPEVLQTFVFRSH